MKAFKVFILGLLCGWLAKSIMDRIYRQDRLAAITRESAEHEERVRSLEGHLHTKVLQSGPQPQTAAQSKPSRRSRTKDDLKQIKGIGPAAEKKLNDRGINTFAKLAQLSSGQLQDILGASKRVTQGAKGMLSQAKQLARK